MDLHAKAPFRRDKRAELRNWSICNGLQRVIFICDDGVAWMAFRIARRICRCRGHDAQRRHRFAVSAQRFCTG
jgi:hypothetical protein